MLKALLFVGILASALALTSKPAKKALPTPKSKLDTTRVLLVGDSLGVGLAGKLAASYPSFSSHVKGGTDIRYWLSNSNFSGALTANPTLVLVSLGTNDTAPASKAITPAILSDRAKKLVERIHAAGAKAVWLMPGDLPWSTDTLYDAVAASGADFIANQPLIDKADGIHPSGTGYKTWADSIVKQVSNG